MKIDFEAIEVTELPRFLGGDGVFRVRQRVDELGKILRGALDPGSSIGPHTHATSSEIIYILSGTGKVLYDGGYETVGPGDCHYCPKGHTHSLINDGAGPLEILAVVPNQ